MAWEAYQRIRLKTEQEILNQRMPDFKFYQLTENTYVYGVFQTNCGNQYGIRINIPSGFPDQCPKAYIITPNPLLGFGNQKTIQSYGASHDMHTLKPHEQGWVQVCHFRAERWSASNTLFLILLKVRLWLEAYEIHRKTGKMISNFLADMKEETPILDFEKFIFPLGGNISDFQN